MAKLAAGQNKFENPLKIGEKKQQAHPINWLTLKR